jgi:hypothetical protein
MSTEQALGCLVRFDREPGNEAALPIMTALEHGASVSEVAVRVGLSPEALEHTFPGAIDEAGWLSQFRHPSQPPHISAASPPIFVAADAM